MKKKTMKPDNNNLDSIMKQARLPKAQVGAAIAAAPVLAGAAAGTAAGAGGIGAAAMGALGLGSLGAGAAGTGTGLSSILSGAGKTLGTQFAANPIGTTNQLLNIGSMAKNLMNRNKQQPQRKSGGPVGKRKK